MPKLKSKWGIGSTVGNVILGIWTVLILLPIIWTLFNALKSSSDILTKPWALPLPPNWDNFVNVWKQAGIGTGFKNSVIVTFVSIFTIVGLSALPAYVSGRIRFKSRNSFTTSLISGLMFPTFIAMG
ncbi:ABC transporter permease family protein [Numidum massiliense]|uniref:carbohydrate ABC transporter permease n=1 Tax=Numidum massiliense TaxID=1522315 RepID=UPI0006D5B244|nr:carbohydrate ABC transporter permease [Numidum massiliense]